MNLEDVVLVRFTRSILIGGGRMTNELKEDGRQWDIELGNGVLVVRHFDDARQEMVSTFVPLAQVDAMICAPVKFERCKECRAARPMERHAEDCASKGFDVEPPTEPGGYATAVISAEDLDAVPEAPLSITGLDAALSTPDVSPEKPSSKPKRRKADSK